MKNPAWLWSYFLTSWHLISVRAVMKRVWVKTRVWVHVLVQCLVSLKLREVFVRVKMRNVSLWYSAKEQNSMWSVSFTLDYCSDTLFIFIYYHWTNKTHITIFFAVNNWDFSVLIYMLYLFKINLQNNISNLYLSSMIEIILKRVDVFKFYDRNHSEVCRCF